MEKNENVNEEFNANVLIKRVVRSADTIVPFNDAILAKRNPVIKVLLSWEGEADLDLAAFMLDKNDSIRVNENLIFYNTERRWKTELEFDDENYNPLNGRVSEWDKCRTEFENNNDKWFFATLPLSLDDSVIGPRDERGKDDDKNENEEDNKEELYIRLNEIDVNRYRSIAIVASIYPDKDKPGQTFSDVYNPTVHIYDADANQQDIEYLLNNDNLNNCECVVVGFVKYNSNTSRWDYVTADKGFDNFATAIRNYWSRR